MAKQKVKAMVGVVLALVIAGVLIGYLLPIGVSSVESDETINQTQDVGTTYEVDAQLNSTVTSVTDGTDATVELYDESSDTTVSKTVAVGSTVNYQLPGGNVSVTVNEANSGTPGNASLTYEVPNDFGWDDGAQSLFGLLPLFLVLVPLVVVVGWAMRSM
jgi:hypothetical protein